jgi:hypothetical protein
MSCIFRYTYDKKFGDDPAISSVVIALFVFSVLAPWWPNQESDRTKIRSVSYSDLVVHVCTKFQVNSSSGYETCPAMTPDDDYNDRRCVIA